MLTHLGLVSLNYFLGRMRIEEIIYFLVCGNKNEARKTMITPHTAEDLLLGFHFPGLITPHQKSEFNL